MSKSGESSIVTKCAKVMDVISNARKPMVFSDIVQETGFVKSSAHRILAVLQNELLIEYDKQSRTYLTGPRLRGWAISAWRRIDLQQIASDAMNQLSDRTGMNTALSILDRETVLYLRTVDVVQFRYASHAGDHVPLHSTAAGKVFLANMSARKLKETLPKLTLEKLTENTCLKLDDLSSQLEVVRKDGFAKALGEEQLQVTGIAAPIHDAEDKVTACLSLWSLSSHAKQEEVLAQSELLIDTAKQISTKLGWSG